MCIVDYVIDVMYNDYNNVVVFYDFIIVVRGKDEDNNKNKKLVYPGASITTRPHAARAQPKGACRYARYQPEMGMGNGTG